jgi:hypothetical protein
MESYLLYIHLGSANVQKVSSLTRSTSLNFSTVLEHRLASSDPGVRMTLRQALGPLTAQDRALGVDLSHLSNCEFSPRALLSGDVAGA